MINHLFRANLLLLSLWLAPMGLWAQDSDSIRYQRITHQIGIDARGVYVAPTSKYLREDGLGENLPLRKGGSLHLKYGFRLAQESRLGRLYPYATQGIGLAYNRMDNPREVGNPVSVYLFQSSRVASLTRRLSLDYEWNFGASFGWKPYDEAENPRNKVVGSPVNAYLNVGFFLNARLSDHCSLLAGIDLAHYSNGNTRLPNSGVNTLGGRVGLVYTLNPRETEQNRSLPAASEPAGFWRRVSCDVTLYAATRAKGVELDHRAYILPGRFGILGFNLNLMYKFNRFLKAGVSLDGQYDESANIAADGYVLEEGVPRFYRPPLYRQVGVGLSARGEFTMPVFSINIGIGHNIYYNKGNLRGLYQIAALKVAVARHLFLHIGYQLHKFHEPNNLMIGIGYRFHDR